jgi:hypothetical protein
VLSPGQHLNLTRSGRDKWRFASGAAQGAIASKHLTSRCTAATGGWSGLRTDKISSRAGLWGTQQVADAYGDAKDLMYTVHRGPTPCQVTN